MKRMSSIIVGSLLAVLTMNGTFAAKVRAQDGPGVIFSVPFAFTADGRNIDTIVAELKPRIRTAYPTWEHDRFIEPAIRSL